MKIANLVILVLIAAVLVAGYFLATKLFPDMDQLLKKGMPAIPGIEAPRQDTVTSTPPAPSPLSPSQQPPPALATPQPASPLPQAPAPQKKEPRHVRDIKVVLYMTDW